MLRQKLEEFKKKLFNKSKKKDYKLPLATVGSTTYEVLNSTYPKNKTAKMLYTYQDVSDIYIPLWHL